MDYAELEGEWSGTRGFRFLPTDDLADAINVGGPTEDKPEVILETPPTA